MNSRALFVGIGLAVNLLVLARGVILMLVLDYTDLGLVALVQAAIALSGLMHFGLLNGGYRLLCHAGVHTRQRIVDFGYCGLAVIGVFIALVALGYAMTLEDALQRLITGLAALGGIATLMRSWIANELVARQRLKTSNLLNAVSIAVSLAVLALLIPGANGVDPALLAVCAIVAQPFVFVALALVSGATTRPRSLRASRRLGAIVFKAGFVLFLTGLAIQAMAFMERAYVGDALGLESLGRLYLAFLFLTLFQMVPNLVQQVFLPLIVKHWKAKEGEALADELRMLLSVSLLYCAGAAIALWLLAEPVLTLVLPQYVPDLRWVYALAPGLIAFALSAPFALCFNVVIEYRWYVIAYGAGVVVTALVFAAAIALRAPLSLDQVIALRSAVYAVMAGLLVLGWWRLTRQKPEFHFLRQSAARM